MFYLLLIPISLGFGTCFFLLGRISYAQSLRNKVKRIDYCSPYPTNEYECRPEMMYFKDGKRIFPNRETVSDEKHNCDTILQVLKCRGKLTDIMVVFKSRFTIANGFPKASA